jgi:hypothetical protein
MIPPPFEEQEMKRPYASSHIVAWFVGQVVHSGDHPHFDGKTRAIARYIHGGY